MSTRGAIGFKTSDREVVIYNHSDSYPSGLGVDVMNWVAKRISAVGYDNFIGQTKQQVRSMEAISDDVPPTPEQIRKCENACTIDLGVSNQSLDDWYCLLRGAQGDIEKTLEVGLYEDSASFLQDSLFCEYAYIVNLETEQLEFYCGFQKDKAKVKGRYKDAEPNNGYYAVSEELTIPLASITTDTIDAWIAKMEGDEEEDEAA